MSSDTISDTSEPPYSMVELIVPPEYRSLVEDLCRMVMIQVVANFLFYTSDPSKHSFFSATFFKTLLFVVVGVCSYWLVLRKVVSFGPNQGYSESKFWYGGGN
jgi:hypothetical protein